MTLGKIKPKLRLDFSDFGCINKVDNWFTNILQREFTVEINDRPDLLIFQEGGHLNRLYTCRKLFWTGESIMPDWRKTDYAMTCHYLDDSRNLRFPYYVWGSECTPIELIKGPDYVENVFNKKNKFCSTVFSNGNKRRAGARIDFFLKLNDKKTIDSGGRFMNNIGGSLPIGGRPKRAFNEAYKFHMCFENKEMDGYTTEKIVDAMWPQCIPIYWGNRRVNEEFNTKSMLCRYDYSSDDDFINRILEVDNDDDLYRSILKEPFFHNNKPNEFYSEDRILEFLIKVIEDKTSPISHKRKFWHPGRWKLAKRMHL